VQARKKIAAAESCCPGLWPGRHSASAVRERSGADITCEQTTSHANRNWMSDRSKVGTLWQPIYEHGLDR